MTARNDGGRAFAGGGLYQHDGMSLRDYIAIHAMAGSLSGTPGSHLVPELLARESYYFADAMLAAREQES